MASQGSSSTSEDISWERAVRGQQEEVGKRGALQGGPAVGLRVTVSASQDSRVPLESRRAHHLQRAACQM